ncbi:MAG: hypothetical protein HRT57_09220 [Crocinitomicaceae bacterium]|nr:hypothetical protein [Crocinitomicaceae bacterium]
MKKMKLTKQHGLGVLIGVVSPLVFIPIVIFIFSWIQNFSFGRLWSDFKGFDAMQVKVITVALLSNLIWFYMTLNREFFNIGRGIIIATFLFAPYIVYVKFF